jgi:hypothetical protein
MTARNLPPRAVGYREAVATAREAMAEALYDIEAVFAALAVAAAKGETFHVISPPSPFDLQHTVAAKALCEALRHEGCTYVWERRDHPRGGEEDPFFDLVVRWGAGPNDHRK